MWDIYIRKSLKSIYTLLRHLHRLNPCPLYSPGENSNIFIVVLSETAPLSEWDIWLKYLSVLDWRVEWSMRLTCTIILYKMPLTVSTYTKSSWANPSILYFPLKHFHSIVLHGPTYDYYWLLELHLFVPQLYSGGDSAINKCSYLSSLVFRYLFCITPLLSTF